MTLVFKPLCLGRRSPMLIALVPKVEVGRQEGRCCHFSRGTPENAVDTTENDDNPAGGVLLQYTGQCTGVYTALL